MIFKISFWNADLSHLITLVCFYGLWFANTAFTLGKFILALGINGILYLI